MFVTLTMSIKSLEFQAESGACMCVS